mgnify:CR=1 FL=1
MNPVDPVRDAAIDVLSRVWEKGVHLDVALDVTLRRRGVGLSARGKRFLSHLSYQACRWRRLADYVLSTACEQPLDRLPMPVLIILRLAVTQMYFSQTVHRAAAVSTSVELARKRGHAGLARLVNAVLRRVPPDLEAVPFPDPARQPVEYLRLRWSLPRWLVRQWVDQFGLDTAARLCEHVNREAPLFLRIRPDVLPEKQLLRQLERHGCRVMPWPGGFGFLKVESARDLAALPPLRSGACRVQNPASALAPRLLEPRPGERVLDLCAAPGTKTLELCDLCGGNLSVTALDPDAGRLNRLRAALELTGERRVTAMLADGIHPPFPGGSFDAVLVDAPCSGLGTLRHNPDIRDRLKPADLDRLAALQRDLLRSAADLCKNGGRIIYSVCTFTPQETRDISAFAVSELSLEPEAGPEALEPWTIQTGQYQTSPLDAALDGFFLTRFRKRC